MTVPTRSPVVNSDLEHSTQMTQRGLCRSIKVWRKSWKCSWRHIPSLWVPLPAAKLSFLDAWATGPGALKQSAGGTDNYRKWSLWVCVCGCVCNALGSHSSRHHKVTYHCSYRTKNPVIIFDICICTCVCVCVCVCTLFFLKIQTTVYSGDWDSSVCLTSLLLWCKHRADERRHHPSPVALSLRARSLVPSWHRDFYYW